MYVLDYTHRGVIYYSANRNSQVLDLVQYVLPPTVGVERRSGRRDVGI